jgi:hypothetical protein
MQLQIANGIVEGRLTAIEINATNVGRNEIRTLGVSAELRYAEKSSAHEHSSL